MAWASNSDRTKASRIVLICHECIVLAAVPHDSAMARPLPPVRSSGKILALDLQLDHQSARVSGGFPQRSVLSQEVRQ